MSVEPEQVRRDDVEAFTALVNNKNLCSSQVYYAWVDLRNALLAELEQAEAQLAVVPELVEALRGTLNRVDAGFTDGEYRTIGQRVRDALTKWEQAQGETP